MNNDNPQTPFTRLDESKRYKAEIKTALSDKWTEVCSTANSPDSSYGLQCWVDKHGNSYGQIGYISPFIALRGVREVTEDEAEAFLANNK